MPRQARTKSSTGIYHIVARGINRQDIFLGTEDFVRYLEILKATKTISKFELYGYCMMTNHVHLLICERSEGISKIMERLGTRYAWWYNFKYDRVGHVFQDRFKSENVEDERYLLGVIRYIHNNPVKAMMVEAAEDYKWSSCRAYYGSKEYPCMLTDKEFILDLFSKKRKMAIERFKGFMKEESEETFMECKSMMRKTDSELCEEIKKLIQADCTAVRSMAKTEQEEAIRRIKKIEGATQRQIARVLGIHQSKVFGI